MSDEELQGPWLQTAVFCDRVLHEKDDVISLIRIVDRFTVTAEGPEPPARMPAGGQLNVTGMLMFKSGFARGSYPVKIVGRTPNNRPTREIELPMFLEGEDRGVNLGFQMTIQNLEEGLYWFDVMVGDRVVTRMPLRVIYQRIVRQARPPR
jgi:hypothetical protein